MKTLGACLLALAIGASAQPDPARGYSYPGDAMYVYCADRPGACWYYCAFPGCDAPDSMFIFIRTADSLQVTGAHFQLEATLPECDSIEAVVPCPGVTIESGDLAGGMTVSFAPIQVKHFEVLKIILKKTCEDPVPWNKLRFITRDCSLVTSAAETIPLADYWTGPVYPDCYYTSLQWFHPDTVNAEIGGRTDVKIQWSFDGPYFFGCYVTVADEQGWVSDHTFTGVWYTGCGTCSWDIETAHVYVEVPPGTPVGALSRLTVTPEKGASPASVVLRAVPGISVRGSTWGDIKSRFK